MLYHSYIFTKQTWYVATEITCSSALPITSCDTNLNIFAQQVNVFAEGLEGKCMLSVIYTYMGINPCVLIWRKLANSNFQDFCHVW